MPDPSPPANAPSPRRLMCHLLLHRVQIVTEPRPEEVAEPAEPLRLLLVGVVVCRVLRAIQGRVAVIVLIDRVVPGGRVLLIGLQIGEVVLYLLLIDVVRESRGVLSEVRPDRGG